MTISQPAQTCGGGKGVWSRGSAQHLLLGCSFGFPYHVINLYHKCNPLSLVNGIVEQLPSIHTVLSHNLQLVPHHHSNFKSNLRIPWIRSQFLCKTKQQTFLEEAILSTLQQFRHCMLLEERKPQGKSITLLQKFYPNSQVNCVYFK